jgi:hypothetical protein
MAGCAFRQRVPSSCNAFCWIDRLEVGLTVGWLVEAGGRAAMGPGKPDGIEPNLTQDACLEITFCR